MRAPEKNAGEPGRVRGEERPNLPWFQTWGAVYGFVGICFLLYVVGLALFSRLFS